MKLSKFVFKSYKTVNRNGKLSKLVHAEKFAFKICL